MAESQPTQAAGVLQRIWEIDVVPGSGLHKLPYPPVSSIPRTSASRLAEATPSNPPDEPILSSSSEAAALNPHPDAPATVLYLAYGSNLAAATFLGARGIRPLSQVNVAAPTLRLTFDLPGMPYTEPCFANTAIRKLPKLPDKPPKIPDPPNFPPPTTHTAAGETGTNNWPGDAEWDKGLMGVVYEVTASDYSKIIATEGGGASYQDILVPCFALPPSMGVPEKPPVPELPKPFVAHTLFAPRLPDLPDGEATRREPPEKDPMPPWAKKFFRPVRRPHTDYAQPSARYLNLLRDGAREHELPADYQAYLAALQPYRITSFRQRMGQGMLALLIVPLFIIVRIVTPLVVDKDGRLPLWVGVVMAFYFNLLWTVYDFVLKPICGDGERTEENNDGAAAGGSWGRRHAVGLVTEQSWDIEKRPLMV